MFYDTVIFDLDGTLLNTLPDLHGAVNYALSAHSLPTRSLDEVRCFVGNGIFNLIKRALPEGCDDETTDKVFACFKSYYGEHSNDMTKPYNGIEHLLCRLKGDGVKLGVVSNKAQFAVTEIIKYYFGDTFHIALGEREGVPRKPHPQGVYDAMSELDGKKVLYVGDSEVDVETAVNAEVDSVMVTWGFRSADELRAAGANDFADTAEDLYNVIMEGR